MKRRNPALSAGLAAVLLLGTVGLTACGDGNDDVAVLESVDVAPTPTVVDTDAADASSSAPGSESAMSSDPAAPDAATPGSSTTPESVTVEGSGSGTSDADAPESGTSGAGSAESATTGAGEPDVGAAPQKQGDAKTDADPESKRNVETFTPSGVERAKVRLNAPGQLTVDHSLKAGNARVEVRQPEDRVIVDVKVDKGTLNITTKCRSKSDRKCRAKVVVAVAPGTPLDLYTSVGDIDVDHPNRKLVAASDVGNIVVTRPGAAVDARTEVGDITIRNARSGAYVGASGVGSVFVSVAAEAEKIASIEASTGTGSVEVVVPKSGAKFAIEAKTGLGERTVDVPSAGSGGTPISADVGIGDVTVRFA